MSGQPESTGIRQRTGWDAEAGTRTRRLQVAKGQKRSNREQKKPKRPKDKVILAASPSATTRVPAMAKLVPAKKS